MPEALAPPVWVDSNLAVELMLRDLASRTRVAVDTESNSLHAFRERVCLLQFSTSEADYLVDPFSATDLSGLGAIFADARIEKIFHAAEYDLICLRRDFGFQFVQLFDTMQAARIIGYTAVGLDSLLHEKFGLEIDKRHQKGNWAARPLSEGQIDYARLDTHYLFALRDQLELELIEKDRLQFAQEDFARACLEEIPRTRSNGEAWDRFAARKDLTLRELTILAQLCDWRLLLAEKLDRPIYKVLVDDLLLTLAKNAPQSKEDLSAAGLSEKQIKLWGEPILSTIQLGMAAPLVARKPPPPKNEAAIRRLEKLKTWRKNLGRELAVESDIILPKPYLSTLAEHPPRSLDELAQLMKDAPARVEKFGPQILHALGGTYAN